MNNYRIYLKIKSEKLFFKIYYYQIFKIIKIRKINKILTQT